MVRTNFDRQMAELNGEIVAMGLLCKQAIEKVAEALCSGDAHIARPAHARHGAPRRRQPGR